MKALVLSGGGAKGCFQAAALRYIMGELKISYDILTGISVGAINSSFLSMFSKEQNDEAINKLLDFWMNLDNHQVYKKWFPFRELHALWLSSLYNSDPLIDLIKSKIDLNKIRSSGKQIAVGAVSLTTGKYKTFTQNDDNFVDGILASSSFPAGLKPIKINNELYTDGGVKHITALNEAIQMGADEIDIILCSPEIPSATYNENSNALKLALRAIDLMTDEIIDSDLKILLMYNKIVALDPNCGKRIIKINIIRPDIDLTDDSLDFSPDKIKEMMDIGYQMAKSKYIL